ncbi:MAG TPA: hypothetical protein VF723_04195 [Pyrinomonadaceae bacterium]|jgi:hypothetical protein
MNSRRRSLPCTLLLFLLLCPAPRTASAQTSSQPARKLDEFGDIQYSDLIARLDNLAVQLQEEAGTRAFLIVYRTRRDLPGLSNKYALRMRSYLVNTRAIPKERVVTVDGGVAQCLTQELWIVPVGAAPVPRRDAYPRVFEDTDSARKFDEHFVPAPGTMHADASDDEIENAALYLEAFATALKREPRSRAHLIGYAQYYIGLLSDYDDEPQGNPPRRVHLDAPGTARRALKTERDILIKTYGIARSRISVADGGYRRFRQVELWIVPPGQPAPPATPNAFPRGRLKRGK